MDEGLGSYENHKAADILSRVITFSFYMNIINL